MFMILTLSACGSNADKETVKDSIQLVEGNDIVEEEQLAGKQKQPGTPKNQLTEIMELSEGAKQAKEAEQSEEKSDHIDGEQEKREENQPDKKMQTWQSAYLEIIYQLQDHLVQFYEPDGTNSRSYLNPIYFQIYLGIHDFDDDGILELIAGDAYSIAVFTYKDGQAERIADLYFLDATCINGVHFKNHSISINSDGAGGSDYVNFGYLDGEYVLGRYNELYMPAEVTMNTLEEMNRIYTMERDKRSEDERKEWIRLVKENERWIMKYQSGEEVVLDSNFDFNLIIW